MTCSVTYLLIAPGSVELRYDLITDAPTIVNLTQHTYFNLASEASTSVLDHKLTIHGSYYTPVNPTLIPTGQIASVDGTALVFQQPVSRRRALSATHPQLGIAGRFDHTFLLHRASARLVRAATQHEPRSGRVLHVSTTEPGLQLYDGHRLDGATTGVEGRVLDRDAGLCLETSTISTPRTTLIFPLSNCGAPNAIARRRDGSFSPNDRCRWLAPTN